MGQGRFEQIPVVQVTNSNANSVFAAVTELLKSADYVALDLVGCRARAD